MGLDAVELVIATEETFGITIADADAEQMLTPGQLIDYVRHAVKSQPKRRACVSQRAFHRVRRSLLASTQVDRRSISLATKVRELFPKTQRVESWKNFRQMSGLTHLPDLRFGRGVLFPPTEVRCLVFQEASRIAEELSRSGDWSDSEVREVVRLNISEQLGIEKFSDDDKFVQDLGLD